MARIKSELCVCVGVWLVFTEYTLNTKTKLEER